MARSYSSRAFVRDRQLYSSVVRGDAWPSRSWTVSSGKPTLRGQGRARVAQHVQRDPLEEFQRILAEA